MSEKTLETKKSQDREVLITRIFKAPRDLVFKAWTEIPRLQQWYAPNGCSVHFLKLDFTPGGRFHSCITTPDGDECWCIGEYLAIITGEKIVSTMINADEAGNPIDPANFSKDPDWPPATRLTVTFTDHGDGTLLTLHQTVLESIAKRTGAYPSWLQMLDRLGAILEKSG